MAASLCALLGIEHPIALAPFGGLSSIDLTATVSNLGGLGSYGLYGYSADRIEETLADLRAATDRPFAVNLWLPTGDEVRPGEADLAEVRDVVAPFFAEPGAPLPPEPAAFLPDFAEQADAALAGRPAALSLVYGVPPQWLLERAHAQ